MATVARFFTLVALAAGSAACGGSLNVPNLTPAAGSNDGITIEPVTAMNPTLASSVLADFTPVVSAPALTERSCSHADSHQSGCLTHALSVEHTRPYQHARRNVHAITNTATGYARYYDYSHRSRVGHARGHRHRRVGPGRRGRGHDKRRHGYAGGTLVNATRTQAGLPALKVNGTLTSSANAYAKLMADRNFFSHDGIDGSSPQSRIKASGYAGRFKGEALAAGQSSPQSALNTWLNSPAHRDILMDRNAVEVGIGYYSKPGTTYTTYWVFVTGAP